MTATITLPWPPRDLSPNARVHWAVRYAVGKKQKEAAHILALAVKQKFRGAGGVSVGLTFCPPGAYHFDEDNLVARMKHALDGISAALGIDDRKFKLEAPVIARPKPPHGEVIVTLTPIALQEAA